MEPYCISIKDMSFSYATHQVFDCFSLDILYKNTTIMDNTSSGKTTLLKLLCGRLQPSTGMITYAHPESFKAFLFDALSFDKDTVLEELAFYLNQRKINPKKTTEEIDTFASFFHIKKLLKKKIVSLEKEEQYFIKVLSYLIMQPEMIFFDNILDHLSKKMKQKIFSYMKEKKIHFIQVTSNIEDVMYGEYFVILHEGAVAIEGETLAVLQEEKLLRRLGFNLPFLVDLCTQLKYYDLLKTNYLTLEEMEEYLWK